MARPDAHSNLYGEVDSLEDLREIGRRIRAEMDGATSRDQLTELKKRSDYLCTLAEAPSWEEQFGDRIGRHREVAKEEDRRSTAHANAIAPHRAPSIWSRRVLPSHRPFPIPDNLRYTELETTFENVGFPMFYGEVGFDEGLKKTQDECQKIMDQPRG